MLTRVGGTRPPPTGLGAHARAFAHARCTCSMDKDPRHIFTCLCVHLAHRVEGACTCTSHMRTSATGSRAQAARQTAARLSVSSASRPSIRREIEPISCDSLHSPSHSPRATRAMRTWQGSTRQGLSRWAGRACPAVCHRQTPHAQPAEELTGRVRRPHGKRDGPCACRHTPPTARHSASADNWPRSSAGTARQTAGGASTPTPGRVQTGGRE